MTQHSSASGFTLLETLVATGLLVTAVAGLAQLFTLSVRFTRESGQYGAALVAAQDKLESLRSLRFGYDDAGNPAGDLRLDPSPPESLDQEVDSYSEGLDEHGNVVDAQSAIFVRRWSIRELASDDPTALAIDVCVFEVGAAHSMSRAQACVGTVRVRQP